MQVEYHIQAQILLVKHKSGPVAYNRLFLGHHTFQHTVHNMES